MGHSLFKFHLAEINMKAKLKTGKIIFGKLAEVFVKQGIAVEISEDEIKTDNPNLPGKKASNLGRKPGKNKAKK